MGKRLSDQVEFTVSQNLRENGKATFIVSYFPRRNVELRALSRDTARPVSAFATRSRSAAARAGRHPSGGHGRASAASRCGADPGSHRSGPLRRSRSGRRRVRLPRAAEDIDRIREAFHKQGFLEARVRTRRSEEADGAVALEFIVERGRAPFSRSPARSRLRTWSRSSKRRGTRTSSISS